MNFKENIVPGLIALIITIISFITVFMITLFIACTIDPPVHIDAATGEKHVVMIIGQTILSLLAASVISLPVFVLSFHYFKKAIYKRTT